MAVSTGALLATLIPAAVVFAYNYIGDKSSFLRNTNSIDIDSLANFTSNFTEDNTITLNETSSTRLLRSSEELEYFTGPSLPSCCNLKVSSDNQFVYHCSSGGSDGSSKGKKLSKTSVWNVPGHLFVSKENTKFKLEKNVPQCKSGNFTGRLSLNSSNPTYGYDHFLLDSYLKFKHEYYRPDEYCINGFKEKQLEITICKPNCDDADTPCIQKCCGMNEIYSLGIGGSKGGCVPVDDSHKASSDNSWSPALYHDISKKLLEYQIEDLRPHIIQKNPSSFKSECATKRHMVYPYGKKVSEFLGKVLRKPFPHLEFRLRKDGWLMHPNSTQEIAISTHTRTLNYCIDGVKNYGEVEPFSNKEHESVLFLCAGPPEEKAPTTTEKTMRVVTSMTKSVTTSTTTSRSTSKSPATTTTTKPTTRPTTNRPTIRAVTMTTKKPVTTTTEKPTTTTTKATTTTTKAPTTTTTTTTKAPTTTTTTTSEKPNQIDSVASSSTTISSTAKQLASVMSAAILPSMKIPNLPTCCEINPLADEEDEITHYCRNNNPNDFSKTNNSKSYLWMAAPSFMLTNKISMFRLKTTTLGCKNQWTKAFIQNFNKPGINGNGKNPVFMTDGGLKYKNEYFSPKEYCINGIYSSLVEVLLCKADCSSPDTPCIQKCCGPNQIYSLGAGKTKRGCVSIESSDEKWRPVLYNDMNSKVTDEELTRMRPHVIQKFPPKFQYNCFKNITLVFPFSKEVVPLMSPLAQVNLEFRLRKDGKVMYRHPNLRNPNGGIMESVFNTPEFCVDGIRNYGENEAPFANRDNQTILFVCALKPTIMS